MTAFDKMIETIKNYALPLWYASLFLSLLIFSIYFVEIQYFPIKSYDSLIAISLFVSFVFLIVILFLTLLLLFSSHLQKKLISNERTCTLVFGSKFYRIFHKIIKEAKYRSIERKVLLKLIKILVIYHIAAFISLIILFSFIPLLAVIVTILFPMIAIIDLKNTDKQSKLISIFHIASSITTSSLFLILIVSIFTLLNHANPPYSMGFITQSICIFICLLLYSTATIIPFPKIKGKLQKPVILTFVMIILLVINGSLFELPKFIIEYFRIGNIHQATITTNKKGCYLLKNNGLDIDCKSNQSVLLIPHINILWRIDEYVVSFRDINGHYRRLILNPSITKIYDIESTT